MDISLLKKVLNLPTAPFHEEAVLSFIKNFCRGLEVRVLEDRYGNLKIVYKKGKGRACFALEAHTDHPGFEVIRGGVKPVVQLLGGVPDRFFKKAKVVVWNKGEIIEAKVTGVINKKKRLYRLTPHPSLSLKGRGLGRDAFGTFDLPGIQIKNGLIYTKAADDLINVAVMLNLLKELVRKKGKAHVIFLFTRAEEVGFVGALGVAKNGFVSKKIPILVLEASNAKAGKVTIGGGPVLRVGDRASTFSHDIDLWLQRAAKNIPHQRALLAGGRCESTVYIEKGYQTGCLAFPLGNYHNIGEKNYAPELIGLNDYKNMLGLLFALSQSRPIAQVVRKNKGKLDQFFKRYASRLLARSK